MSILIKGMKMPNLGHAMGILLYPNGDAFILSDEIPVTMCKAVELPPHGRLIDASTKVTIQKSIRFYDEILDDYNDKEMTIDELLNKVWVIGNAPTIIEAEGEK